MKDINYNEDTSAPQSRVKKGSNTVLYLFIITIASLIGGFYFYQKNISTYQQIDVLESDTTAVENVTGKSLSQNRITNISKELNNSPPDRINTNTSQQAVSSNQNLAPLTGIQTPEENLRPTTIILTKESTQNTDFSSMIREMDRFYSHLDSQQYMRDFNLPELSKEYFSNLIQKLIDNPPIVTRETDDLFTLLKNTAHFFRVIGKKNILVLKGILDREKNSFETILKSFYQLTYKPEYLQKAYSITLDTTALYDYAGFFLHTMGGRLYLFRRDSTSRMAVSFYSILIIDRANDSGDSRHGIDIRPAIDSLIEEIENGGKNLQLRNSYLDTLYDLKEKYS